MADSGMIPVGKVPGPMLARLLGLPRPTSERVLVGPGLGEDAAVVDMKAGPLVVTSDPITFKTPQPGHYAVHINANDVAAMGGRPLFFTLTMIMPPQTDYHRIEAIMAQAVEAGKSIKAVLVGGHSEVSAAVNTPVVSVTMFGELVGDRPLCSGDGQTGDAVIQVNPMAVEGTSILAEEYRDKLVRSLGSDVVDRAAGFLENPGLSVLAPATLAAGNLAVHAMHDPTEGGLITGVREIAAASGKGLVLWPEKLLLAEETRQICQCLGYDPLGLISSGCLLFTLSRRDAAEAINLMAEAGFPASEIGYLDGDNERFVYESADGATRNLPDFSVDELAGG